MPSLWNVTNKIFVSKVTIVFSSVILFNFCSLFTGKCRFDRSLVFARKSDSSPRQRTRGNPLPLTCPGHFMVISRGFQECDPIYDNDPRRRTHVVLVPCFEERRQLHGTDKCTRVCGYPIMDTDESKPILTTSRHESKNQGRNYIKTWLWLW